MQAVFISVSVAELKHQDPKQLGQERICLILAVVSMTQGNQGTSSRQAPGGKHGGRLLLGLALLRTPADR